MTRWRLTVEYDGGPFMGWQRQDHGPSVQQVLEEAIERMTGEAVRLHCAGRTDAGVHALAMSAHVDIDRQLTAHRLREGANALVRPLPVSVTDAAPVAGDWHARFSCTGRRYLYRILNRHAPPALDRGRVWHIPSPLAVEAMTAGAAHLVGHHLSRVIRQDRGGARILRQNGARGRTGAGPEVHEGKGVVCREWQQTRQEGQLLGALAFALLRLRREALDHFL